MPLAMSFDPPGFFLGCLNFRFFVSLVLEARRGRGDQYSSSRSVYKDEL